MSIIPGVISSRRRSGGGGGKTVVDTFGDSSGVAL